MQDTGVQPAGERPNTLAVGVGPGCAPLTTSAASALQIAPQRQSRAGTECSPWPLAMRQRRARGGLLSSRAKPLVIAQKTKPRRSGVCGLPQGLRNLHSPQRGAFSQLRSIARSASAQSQRVGPLVEPGRRAPNDLELLGLDVRALPHRLPDDFSRVAVESAALHDSAVLAGSAGKNMPDIRHPRLHMKCLSHDPLVFEQATHSPAPRLVHVMLKFYDRYSRPGIIDRSYFGVGVTYHAAKY